MASLFEIEHVTTYKYKNPVTFGTHRAMFLPRPAARGRLLNWSAKTNLASKIRWVSDALSNNVTVMEFSEPAGELTFTFQFQGVHFGAKNVEEFPLEARAEEVPVQYRLTSGLTWAFTCAPMPRTPTALAAWARVLSPIIRIERPMFFSGCWTPSAILSGTMPGKQKARSLQGKHYARGQVPAAITPG